MSGICKYSTINMVTGVFCSVLASSIFFLSQVLQNDVEKGLVIQKEFVSLNEEVMSIALSSSAPNRDHIFQKLKERMQTNAAGWSTLEDDIDESVALLEKECKCRHQGF